MDLHHLITSLLWPGGGGGGGGEGGLHHVRQCETSLIQLSQDFSLGTPIFLPKLKIGPFHYSHIDGTILKEAE